MNKIISLLQQNQWEHEFDGYYKNIRSLCSHIYVGDFNWLKRFGLLRSFKFLDDTMFETTYSWGELLFDSISEYIDKRNELDLIINSFVEELNPEDLDKYIKYKNWKNEDQNRNFGGLIIHFFNHHTHHRGMISLYLEFLGKENDYSNLLVLV
jgi:uncharacterized damage-inducible protein DinB